MQIQLVPDTRLASVVALVQLVCRFFTHRTDGAFDDGWAVRFWNWWTGWRIHLSYRWTLRTHGRFDDWTDWTCGGIWDGTGNWRRTCFDRWAFRFRRFGTDLRGYHTHGGCGKEDHENDGDQNERTHAGCEQVDGRQTNRFLVVGVDLHLVDPLTQLARTDERFVLKAANEIVETVLACFVECALLSFGSDVDQKYQNSR